jgi:3-hydroxyisobutyrate dehydrogenase-like beta-hydroxyacid dehydrogenase
MNDRTGTSLPIHIALIGYGEVGKIFAAELIGRGASIAFFDILLADPTEGAAMRSHAASIGASPRDSLAAALEGARAAISAVTASSALAVAEEAARHIRPGQFFLDLNSASPATKRRSATLVDAAGGDYVEAAVMGSVPPHGIKVPMILGGARREALARLFEPAGMRLETGVADIGVASAVKMCRSIMIKGLEALTIECLFTARRYGVEEQVLASLAETYPGMQWQTEPDYLVSRAVQHGRRRAAEMREVARTVEEVGLQPLLAAPTALRQDWMADQVKAGTVSRSERSWREVADAIKTKN